MAHRLENAVRVQASGQRKNVIPGLTVTSCQYGESCAHVEKKEAFSSMQTEVIYNDG